MLIKRASNLLIKHLKCIRAYHLSSQLNNGPGDENPITRTFRILGDDLKNFGQINKNEEEKQRARSGLFPRHSDVVIIGGGAVGSAIAYWIKRKTTYEGVRVIVIEKDPSYKQCSTTLSVGGLRQQFSLPENIQMSLFGAEFLRTLKREFGQQADVSFMPHGYLVLVNEEGAQQMIDAQRLQKELGAVNILLTPEQIKERYGWMDVDGVALGCLGMEKEGWFDPWALLSLLKGGAIDMGTQYIHGEVVDFLFKDREDVVIDGHDGIYEGTNGLVIKMADGEYKTMEFAYCVVAAGAESAKVGELAKIGVGNGMLGVPVPVERRKRYVYHFDCQGEPPGINTPMVIDPTGTYFRREGLGGSFIAGLSPNPDDEPRTADLDVDHSYFNEKIWPTLAKRVPAFNAIKVRSAWSGFYEYNYYDENGIIGAHPYYQNVLFATGFSGHGIQQAPAVGRAIAELILDGDFQTIDLTRLGFDRLVVDKPMYEIGIY